MILPELPRRCRAIFYCPRRARKWIITKRGPRAICRWHFNMIDALTRTSIVPEIAKFNTHKHGLYATIEPRGQLILLTDLFAAQPPEYQVFVLAHEHVHVWLRREFGIATSKGLDLIYKRPLGCLRGHSLLTWELNLLFSQKDAAKT